MARPMTAEQVQTLAESKEVLAGTREADFSQPIGPGFTSRYVETLWAAQHLRGTKNVLDIGLSLASPDYLGLLLSAKDEHGVHLEAVDIINPEKVKTRYPESWLKSIFEIPVIIGDVRTAPVPEGKFDTVICISTIEHIGYDKPSSTVEGSAFERQKNQDEVNKMREPGIDAAVLGNFHKALQPGGKVLLTVPMGKGGPILLQDSLGLYCVEWEYEADTWNALSRDPRFTLAEEMFFKNTPRGWDQVASPADLTDVTETIDAIGVGLAHCVLVKK